jgi:hypothetical protein
MPDDQSDDVQSAINQALPPEYRQAIADNMQVAAETRAAKAPKQVSAAPVMPAVPVVPQQPTAVPPVPTPAAITPTPEMVVPTPTPPMPMPVTAPTPVPPVVPTPQPVQPPAPKPMPPKVKATPQPALRDPEPASRPKQSEVQPKDLNEFVSQIEGELIPQTLNMLLDNYSSNREQIHENLRLALWRLGELEMVSSPQDLLHREAIGELAGKLKMLELWAGRLDQKS